jgi:DNA-binding transcriptional regulator GbsR (MarR family)
LDEERKRYVEDFGLFFDQFGLGRMLGRVLGLLLLSDPPERSAAELADELQASRGSMSQATRSLVRLGLVQRISRPGERRDYFRVRPGAWHELMRQEMSSITMFRRMAERGLEIQGAAGPEARLGLEEMRDFYAYWERELPAVLERWERETERKR